MSNDEPIAASPCEFNLVKIMWVLIIFIHILSPILIFLIAVIMGLILTKLQNEEIDFEYAKRESIKCFFVGIWIYFLYFAAGFIDGLNRSYVPGFGLSESNKICSMFALLYSVYILFRGIYLSFKKRPFSM